MRVNHLIDRRLYPHLLEVSKYDRNIVQSFYLYLTNIALVFHTGEDIRISFLCPNLSERRVSSWKKQLLEEGPSVFGSHTARQEREREAREAELYEQIGRLKMELEWLKKKAARFE
jgi:hypothetical protein